MDPNLSSNARHVASVLFKNTLFNTTKVNSYQKLNDIQEKGQENLWFSQDEATRSNIKDALLQLLGYDDRHTINCAATCIAAIGVLEIPKGMWDDLIISLAQNSGVESITTRLASVQTLGYLCEDLDPEDISADLVNQILGAVLQNIQPNQKELSAIAIKAFARAAPVTNRNF